MAQRMHSGVNVCAQPWSGVENASSMSGWVPLLRNVSLSIQTEFLSRSLHSDWRREDASGCKEQSHLKKSICTARKAKYA